MGHARQVNPVGLRGRPHIAGVFAEWSLGNEIVVPHPPLDHDLGARRHHEVVTLALDHIDGCAPQAARDRQLVEVGHRAMSDGGVSPHDDGYRRALATAPEHVNVLARVPW